MIVNKLDIDGCAVVQAKTHHDTRGVFTKLYHRELFHGFGISMGIAEEFHTLSNKGVLRGMHFQLPPHSHAKLVSCISGKILDVFLDLRKNSVTYGKYQTLELVAGEGKVLYLPQGIAHGFLSLEDATGVHYSTSSVHHPESDAGVLWNSFGFNWPTESPIISERDNSHVGFASFRTPF